MKRCSHLLVALGACLVALGQAETAGRAQEAQAGAPTPHRLRLDECVALALQRNPDVLIAGQEVAESEAARASARGQFGPKLHVDASVQQWTEAYTIPFAVSPGQAPSQFPVHDAFVWNATVTLAQPVTALFAIHDAYQVREIGVDIASIKREAARQDTALAAVQGYYRLLQAERIADVASASVEQLRAQLRRATSFHDNGSVSKDDVLRAQLAVDNAEQRLVQTQSRVAVGRAELASVLGASPDDPIDAAPLPDDAAPPAETPSFEASRKAAEAQRVELVEVDKRLEQTRREVNLAWAKLAPQVTAVGSYIHNEGSLFSQLNSAYVGAVASWDVWDWGATTSGISEAKARMHRAELARQKLDEHIGLEVQKAVLAARAAGDTMAIARASVGQAEEEFTLVKKRYEASAATSFDVIDAEGLLTQARGQLETARYDDLIARASLRRAVGVRAEALAQER